MSSRDINKLWCELDNKRSAEISLLQWFIQLRFKQSEYTHHLILKSLSWFEIELMVVTAADGEPDFEVFASGVGKAALRARKVGLVIPDRCGRAIGGGRHRTFENATLELFEGVAA